MSAQDTPELPGVFVATGDVASAIDHMNKVAQAWTMRAARGECSWVCADCSQTFLDGMPDECVCGHQACTKIIQRDKAEAIKATGSTP